MKTVYTLNWGSVTPELYNKNTNTVVHVFNHCLMDKESIDRSIKFAIGRIEWFSNYLSLDCRHEVMIDDRGQAIDDNVRNIIINSLRKYAAKVSFMSKRR